MNTTQNPEAVVDADTFSVRRTIDIAAPREKVWRTVTEPELVSQWFGRLALTGSGPGAHGTITWPDHPVVPIRVDAYEPPEMVAYRWCNDDAPPDTMDEERSTVFTFTLEETPEGTRLTVVETGFDRTDALSRHMANHREGWDRELDKLVALLERDA